MNLGEIINVFKENRIRAIELLGGVCKACGTEENLEFDHILPETKIMSMSKMWSYSWSRIQEELDKCQLLCKPCHVEKTKSNGEWNNGITEYPVLTGDYIHGRSYYKRGCRCETCRAAERLHERRKKISKSLSRINRPEFLGKALALLSDKSSPDV